MKHARKDYDRIQDPSNKIPTDEPVFLLRAQDLSAPATLRFWAAENLQRGGSAEGSRLACEQAAAMERWPTKKVMDMPEDPK